MKTIHVKGKGQIKVHPDMTRIVITLKGRYKEYSETLRHSAEDTESLRDLLSGLGLERSALKTLRFNVETKYEYKDDKRNTRYFDGGGADRILDRDLPARVCHGAKPSFRL